MAKSWDTELAKQLYDEGMNDQEIGRRVSISPQCIAKWRRQNGLPSNYRRETAKKSAAPVPDPVEMSPVRPSPPAPENANLSPIYLVVRDIVSSVPEDASAEVRAAAADYAAAIVRNAVLMQLSSRTKQRAVFK